MNATGTLHDRNIGLNVFPRNVNYNGESFGGNIFSAQKVPGWLQTPYPSTKDYEHVYITGGEYANWKLLHWEAFTAELHLDGFTGSNKGLPGYYTRINEVPHSIVSGLKFVGTTPFSSRDMIIPWELEGGNTRDVKERLTLTVG